MQGNIIKLYPQYAESSDRRKESKPVSIDRRLLSDRRSPFRIENKDLFREFLEPIQARDRIKEEQNRINKTLETSKMIFAAFSPIIPVRRVSSVPDNIENKDYTKAAGVVAVAAMLLPEDLRDMKDAWNQVVHKKLPKYDYVNCQAPFSFFRGTLLEPLVNKLGKWGYYLHKFDKSLADTRLGRKLRKLLGVSFSIPELTGREVPMVIKDGLKYINGYEKIKAEKLEGSFISKLIYRAMQRTTVIGTGILFALWFPSIIKAFKKPEKTQDKFANAGKQSLKASINITSVVSGIGIMGALGARKGPAWSVAGMGLGSVLGSLFANKINRNIKIQD